ncbi:MAG: hypothetical protein ACLRSW_11710 [Christensenellaceae bacterium]
MTFEEAKEKLKRIRYLKNKARDIVADINECKNNKAALSLKSGLDGMEQVDGGKLNSIEERILLLRLQQLRLNWTSMYEDKLNGGLFLLTETEHDIVGYYMRINHKRLARELHYSEGHIKYLKHKALEKIANKI